MTTTSEKQESEEITKQIQDIVKNGYALLGSSIRDSNSFPSGDEYSKYATHTSFNLITKEFCNISNNIINSVLGKQNVNLKFNPGDDDKEKIVDANDTMLENVNILLDVLSGFRQIPSSNLFKDAPIESSSNSSISSWNKKPIIEKIEMGSKILVAAKNITRPQINFKDPVDNSPNRLWKPKIKTKPNALKPLNLTMIYDEDGKKIGFSHPYEYEINAFDPEQFMKPDDKPPTMPAPLDKVPLTMVENEDQLNELVKHLKTVKEIAVDVEHHSYRTYQGITCLLQLTTESGGDFIVDTISLRDQLYKLNEAMTDPNILKILHGADHDVEWLQRDLSIYLVGVWDTYRATKLLKFAACSLAFLVQYYCNVQLDKRYSLADWRIRPLPDFLLDYARSDTHYLLYVWKRMKADLLKAGYGKTHLLESVFTQTKQVCLKTYQKPFLDENSHLSVFKHRKNNLNSRQLEALKMLFHWRDAVARNEDESTNYVLPEHMLLPLATALPRELQGILALCHPVPPLVRQHLNTLHKIILKCREMPLRPAEVIVATQSHEVEVAVQDIYTHFDEDQTLVRDDEMTAVNGQVKIYIPDSFNMVTSSLYSKSISPEQNCIAKSTLFTPICRYFKYRQINQEQEWLEYNKQKSKVEAIEISYIPPPKEVIDSSSSSRTTKETANKNEITPKSTQEDIPLNNAVNRIDEKKKKTNIEQPLKMETVDLTDDLNIIEVKNASKIKKKHLKRKSEDHNSEKQDGNSKKVKDFKQFDYRNADFNKFHREKTSTHIDKSKKQKYKRGKKFNSKKFK